jgi:hypothetical protein
MAIITYWRNVMRKITTQEMDASFDAVVDMIANAGLSSEMPEGQIYIGDNTNTASLETLNTALVPESTDKNYVSDAELVVIGNTSGTNTGDNATNTTSNTYADGKVVNTLDNGDTTHAPSSDVVYDALESASNTNIYNRSTGVYKGGVLSVGTPNTTFSISDGNGAVADNSTGTNIYTFVSWTGKTNITATYVASGLASYVAIDIAGNVVQQLAPFTQTQSRSLILLGSIIHTNLTNLDAVNNFQDVILSPANMVHDLSHGLGIFNISGNLFSANGANLNLNKTIGYVYSVGSNWANDPLNPSQVTLASLTALTFQYRFQTGTNGATGIAINPNIYDVAGVSTAVPSSKYTIQRIYSFVSNNVKIQPGQAFYQTLAEAKASIQNEIFVTEPSILQNGLLRGFLVIKQGTTSLTNTADCFFYEASKFGGQQGIGGQSVSSIQNAYDNSLSPEILTDTTRGAFTVIRGSTADTDTIYEGQNGAGTTTWSVDGNGLIFSGQATASTPTFFDSAKKLISTTAQLWGTWVQTWASKATPVDADTIGFHNSASTFVGVKSTLLNFWTSYLLPKVQALGYLTGSGLTNTFLPKYNGTALVNSIVSDVDNEYVVVKNNYNANTIQVNSYASALKFLSSNVIKGTIAGYSDGGVIITPTLYYAVSCPSSNYFYLDSNGLEGQLVNYSFRSTSRIIWSTINASGLGVSTGGIYIGGLPGSINPSAAFQVDSTTKGALFPRMTNLQRTNIAGGVPPVGLIVYCTDATEGLYIYKSTGWTFII